MRHNPTSSSRHLTQASAATPSRRHQVGWRHWLTLATLITTLALITGGCGETTSNPVASTTQNTQNQTTTTNSATTTTTTTTVAHTQHHKPSAAQLRAENQAAKASRRADFQSLANAKPAPKLTAAQRAQLPANDIQLTSPNINPQTDTLDPQNTCLGKNQHPTLRWNNIPPNTAEIIILALSTKPQNNKLVYDWAIAGIPPTLHELKEGQTPPGTTTGQNTTNNQPTYNICPPPNTNETYAFFIYALPTKLNPKPNFNPNTLRTQAKQTTHHIGLLTTTTHG